MSREESRELKQRIDNKWATLITVALNGFIIILDICVVNIAFPKLADIFNTEPSVVLWVSVVYSLLTIGLMIIAGRTGDFFLTWRYINNKTD